MKKVTASVACAPLLDLRNAIEELALGGTDMLHIDIMDGHYVPNLALNFDQISAIKKEFSIPMDVHLMMNEPERYIEKLSELGVEYVSFHTDAVKQPLDLIAKMRLLGLKPGVVINPKDSLEDMKALLPHLSYVIVMGVVPGFHGQSFIPETLTRIKKLDDIRKKDSLDFFIEVDGGLDFRNSKSCLSCGADWLVAGAFICFGKNKSISAELARFKQEILSV